MLRAQRTSTSRPGNGGSRSSPARIASDGDARARRRHLRSFRELFELLSLTDQFRVTAVAAVTVTLIGVQLMVTAWDAWATRRADLHLAAELAHSISGEVRKYGTFRALEPLQAHPVFVAADLHLASGEVLERYDRHAGSFESRSGDSPVPAVTVTHGKGLPHRAMRFLGLEPDYVEYPVEIHGQGAGALALLIDNRPAWAAVIGRLSQMPLVLALGVLLGLLAANALKRQVVEPLEQLARSTGVRHGQDAAPPQGHSRRANELNQLATNFDALANRLAEYERDLTNLRVTSRQQIIERTRELEQGLRKAEALTRSKDEFLANMSHEIRTPMNGVLGMAELLAGTDLDKRQRRYVDSMRSAADTMMQIINDILDDSKIEAGKLDLVREAFDVREFAEQVGEVFAGRAESRKLELVCRVEPTVPAAVVGDALRLRQVVGNLVSNAIKYTEQGEVQIRIGVDDLQDDKCRLHFSVSDTGVGIAEADRATVFEAFSQLGNAQRIGGTGLGLSIATRLVQLMGGERIDLISEPGKGSSFSFVLPFKVETAAPAPNAATDEFAGIRVLVVDDSPTTYMYLEETLANWSADVTVLNQGRMLGDRLREAVARQRPFDMVLLDHALPDATTAEMLRTIRLDPALAGTWVVLLSAFDFDPSYEGSRAIKPDMCIAKPVRQGLLKSALRAAREPREAESPEAGPAPEAREAAPRPEGLLSLGLEVLVVDDNVINREVAQAMLERVGCRVTVAEDGVAALDHTRRRSFDAILMDCQMPGMDGYAATAAIRRTESERQSKATPIVALTANVLARDRNRCIEAGMNDFLPKPFTQDQIVATLRPIAAERGTLVLPSPGAERARQARPSVPPDERPAARSPGVVQASQPAATAQVARSAAGPQQVQPAAAPPRPAAVHSTDTDMMLLDFGPQSESVEEILGETVVDEGTQQESLLSDTVVLDMLQVPLGEGDSLNSLPLLDPEQVAAIRGLGKPQVLEHLCQLLFDTAPESLQRLGAALDAGDLEAVATVAHALKSPVNSLGGRRLAEQLERCEAAARDACDIKAARRAARGVKQTYADLEAALKVESARATGT
jgi:signal transduction histidine kinase/DNA-binding response OmpR family regulator